MLCDLLLREVNRVVHDRGVSEIERGIDERVGGLVDPLHRRHVDHEVVFPAEQLIDQAIAELSEEPCWQADPRRPLSCCLASKLEVTAR